MLRKNFPGRRDARRAAAGDRAARFASISLDDWIDRVQASPGRSLKERRRIAKALVTAGRAADAETILAVA